jgi:hypothetical protein
MDEEVYFVDSSARNADHRTVRPGTIVHRPFGYAPSSSRVAYPATSVVYGQPPASMYGQPYGQPSYAQAPFFSPAGPFGILNGLTVGNLVDIGGKLWAAFKGMPAAPTPTGDVATDIANSILFQSALSAECKSEKKIEAVSSAIAELLGAR